MALTVHDYTPTHGEHTNTSIPKKGPKWLIPPTKHASELVEYDGGAIKIPHYESGRIHSYYRMTIRDDHGGLQPIASRLATAAAHLELGEAGSANAIAELCVTGRASLGQLRALSGGGKIDWALVLERTCHAGVLPNVVTRRVASNRARLPIPTRAKVGAVVDRAKAVHQYLLASGPNRANLGWLAVSSEDDLPYRPVNIAATAHIQGEIPVRVWGIDMTLRYARTGDLTATSKNVLLLHGHSSRLEEVEHLMTELAAKGYVVIALDLPSNGCSSQIAHADVLFAEHPVCGDVPIPFEKEDQSLDNHSSLYVLRFLQATVQEVVERLFAEANLPPRIDLLAGGSLGGNLGLLISEAAPFGNANRHARVNEDLSWVGKIASWSPACLWDQPGLAAGTPHGRSLEHETPDRRRDHINRWMNVDHVGPVIIRQAEQWYRKGWADKRRAIAESWLSRHEFYSARFRRWHWIVAHEQVKFSHQDEVRDASGNGLGKKHYELAGGELLLMAGDGDNFPNTNIFDRVKELAPKMPAKGKALLWKDTGHSIHDERPKALADVLDRFVKGTL